MAANPIPVKVSGTHREVGQQIGEKLKPQLRRILPRLRENLPPGVSWQDMLLKGRLSLAHSRAVYPQFVEELKGIAEAADLPFEEVFLAFADMPLHSASLFDRTYLAFQCQQKSINT